MDLKKHILVSAMVAVCGFLSRAAQPQRSSASSSQPKVDPNHIQSIVLPEYPPELPPGPHLDTYQKDCLTCHSARYVTMQPPFSRMVWEKEVKKMIDAYGATIPDAEQREIVDYLVAVRGATEAK
jgi:hypothetical protein